jgi:hypothetical protein
MLAHAESGQATAETVTLSGVMLALIVILSPPRPEESSSRG